MYALTEDIIIYITPFLQYTTCFGSNGLIVVNKSINSILKHTPSCVKRKIKIQNLIIKSCLYHNTTDSIIIKLLINAKKKKKILEIILERNTKKMINFCTK